VARDEHRHVAFGARFLHEMAGREPRYQEAITRTLGEVLPVADGVLRPKWRDPAEDDIPFFGTSVTEARAFAAKALERRLKAIELAAPA
jgi:ribonucleoside-diphosphate reductase beta chain